MPLNHRHSAAAVVQLCNVHHRLRHHEHVMSIYWNVPHLCGFLGNSYLTRSQMLSRLE